MVQTKMAVKQKSLEDDLLDEFGKQIVKEIDEGIMSSILVESGWTPVKFHYKDNFQAVDINEWLNETCEDDWARYGSHYLFKDNKDAEWFILRWI